MAHQTVCGETEHVFVVTHQWRVINELDKLRSLVQLSCRRNPIMFLEKNPETTRQQLIARISQLEILDRSQVN